jgi:hypothetical protein
MFTLFCLIINGILIKLKIIATILNYCNLQRLNKKIILFEIKNIINYKIKKIYLFEIIHFVYNLEIYEYKEISNSFLFSLN